MDRVSEWLNGDVFEWVGQNGGFVFLVLIS